MFKYLKKILLKTRKIKEAAFKDSLFYLSENVIYIYN